MKEDSKKCRHNNTTIEQFCEKGKHEKWQYLGRDIEKILWRAYGDNTEEEEELDPEMKTWKKKKKKKGNGRETNLWRIREAAKK